MRDKKLFQVALEAHDLDEKLDTSELSNGWDDTIIALVENGPLFAGDIPSKDGLDSLQRDGYACRVVSKGTVPEENIFATLKGRDLYIQLVTGSTEYIPLEEVIAKRKETGTVSTEAMSGEAIFTTAILGIVGLLSLGDSYNNWKKKKADKKKFDESEEGKAKKLLETVKRTYLNDSWLNAQSFKSGGVSVPGAGLLTINNTIPNNPSKAVDEFVNRINQLDKILFADYSAYVSNIQKIAEPIKVAASKHIRAAPTEQEKQKYRQIGQQIDESINKLQHPFIKHWSSLPNDKNAPGGIVIMLAKDPKLGPGDRFRVNLKEPINVEKLPALNKDQVKNVAAILARLLDSEIFYESRNVLQNIPMLADGWPYGKKGFFDIDDFDLDLESGLYDVGALAEQYYDPIYEYTWAVEKTYGAISKVLAKWIEESVVVK